jgi:hypothetical protein
MRIFLSWNRGGRWRCYCKVMEKAYLDKIFPYRYNYQGYFVVVSSFIFICSSIWIPCFFMDLKRCCRLLALVVEQWFFGDFPDTTNTVVKSFIVYLYCRTL